jgi:HSP20 family molecular chaperone IbpA
MAAKRVCAGDVMNMCARNDVLGDVTIEFAVPGVAKEEFSISADENDPV